MYLLFLLLHLAYSYVFTGCAIGDEHGSMNETRKRATTDAEPLCDAWHYTRLSSVCDEAMPGGAYYEAAKAQTLPNKLISLRLYVFYDYDAQRFVMSHSEVDELMAGVQTLLDDNHAAFTLQYDVATIKQPSHFEPVQRSFDDERFWAYINQRYEFSGEEPVMIHVIVTPSVAFVQSYSGFPNFADNAVIDGDSKRAMALNPLQKLKVFGTTDVYKTQPTHVLSVLFLHEMGHNLGLYHTFSETPTALGPKPLDARCACTTPRGADVDEWRLGDLVGDTAAAPLSDARNGMLTPSMSFEACDDERPVFTALCCHERHSSYSYKCPSEFGGYQPWNAMSYAPCYCASDAQRPRLTIGQIARMHCNYERDHRYRVPAAALTPTTVADIGTSLVVSPRGYVIGDRVELGVTRAVVAVYALPLWRPARDVEGGNATTLAAYYELPLANNNGGGGGGARQQVSTAAFATGAPLRKGEYRLLLVLDDGQRLLSNTLTLYPATCVADGGLSGVCRARDACLLHAERAWSSGARECVDVDASLGCCVHRVDATAYGTLAPGSQLAANASAAVAPPAVAFEVRGIAFRGASLRVTMTANAVDGRVAGELLGRVTSVALRCADAACTAPLAVEPPPDAGSLAVRVGAPLVFNIRVPADIGVPSAPLVVTVLDDATATTFRAASIDMVFFNAPCRRTSFVGTCLATARAADCAWSLHSTASENDSCTAWSRAGELGCCFHTFLADGDYRKQASSDESATSLLLDWRVLTAIGVGLLLCCVLLLGVLCLIYRHQRSARQHTCRASYSLSRSSLRRSSEQSRRSHRRLRSSTLGNSAKMTKLKF